MQNCSTQCDPVRFADCLVLFSLSGLYVVPALPEQRRDQRPAGVETSVLQEDLHSKLRQVFQLNGNWLQNYSEINWFFHHFHFLNYNLRAVQLLQISHYHLLDVDEDTGVWIERSAGKLTALGILKQVLPYWNDRLVTGISMFWSARRMVTSWTTSLTLVNLRLDLKPNLIFRAQSEIDKIFHRRNFSYFPHLQ